MRFQVIFLITIILLTLSCNDEQNPGTTTIEKPITSNQDTEKNAETVNPDIKKLETPKEKDSVEPRDDMLALYWLEDHQNEDGSWSANFHKNCGTVKHPIKKTYVGRGKETDYKMIRNGVCANKDGSDDSGHSFSNELTTAFALLAFLSVGFNSEQGEFASTVKGGIDYLVGKQQDSGRFARISDYYFMLTNAVCTIVLAENYSRTENEYYKPVVQKSLDFIVSLQVKDEAGNYSGWRMQDYGSQVNPLATSWVMFSLKSCRYSSLKVPEHCWNGIGSYFRSITAIKDGVAKTQPKVDYLPHNSKNFEIMPIFEAAYSLCHVYTGKKRSDELYKSLMQTLKNEKNWISDKDPMKIDFMYWYYALYAIGQYCGQYYKNWESTKINTLLRLQRTADSDKGKCVYGSWDPIDVWGQAGGRVYSTAICCIVLNVWFREYIAGYCSRTTMDYFESKKETKPVKKKEKTEEEKKAEEEDWKKSWGDW